MALNAAILNIGVSTMQSAMAYVALHSAVPDAAGSNHSAAPRRPSAWAAPTNGDFVSASINFTGGVANGPVKAAGFWSAEHGGLFYGYYPVAGDQIFNASGDYTLAAFTLVNTSS